MNHSFLRSNTFVFLLLTAVVFLVFGNALFNEYSYDDHYLILNNQYIQDFSHFKDFLFNDVTVMTSIEKSSGYYRPVSMIFLVLNYKLWGFNAFGLHLMSVIIHLLNCFFVFLIIKQIAKNFWISFLSSLIFAVHPIHVEAVAPIFNYMGILASFFALFSFWAFVKSDSMRNLKYVILSVVLFLFSVFSKEEAIILPGIFVLYDFYFCSGYSVLSVLRKWKQYLFLIAPAILYIALRFLVFGKQAALGFWNMNIEFNIATNNNAWDQVAIIFYVFFKYFSILIFPVNLTAFYLIKPATSLMPIEIFVSIFSVLFLVGYAILSARRNSIVSFFIGWFFVSSIMISNIIPIGGLFSERFMYFPSVAYCFFIGYFFYRLPIFLKDVDNRKRSFFAVIGFLVIFILYAQKTVARNYVWKNDITLWSDTAKKTPESYRPYLSLADAYHFYGEQYYDKALDAYLKVLEYPEAPKLRVQNSIGKFYGMQNNHQKALEYFKAALVENPEDVDTLYNVGVTYYFLNQNDEAARYFEKVNFIDKDYPWGYYGLGLVFQKKGQNRKAKELFAKALELDPEFKSAQIAWEAL
ncbi:MAG: tetratricopeptide repeat protein [Candidatus Omnitrophica bacterium]|nr:tetratricopeptide repeat protein [Candidatus Omnitrophota bacterium]